MDKLDELTVFLKMSSSWVMVQQMCTLNGTLPTSYLYCRI